MANVTIKFKVPHMKGKTVKAFQGDLNDKAKDWGVNLRIAEDGEWGVRSRDMCATICYGLGIAQDLIEKGISPAMRTKIRNSHLTSEERKRYNDRKGWRSRLKKTHAGSSNGGGGGNTFVGSPLRGQRPRPSTHQTGGLPGYPAVDYFAKAGTTCVSPVTGKVTKLSGHDPKKGAVGGAGGPLGWSVYIKGNNGKTYYLTHLGQRLVKVGQSVKAGQKIGTVANYAKFGRPDHIHQGVKS